MPTKKGCVKCKHASSGGQCRRCLRVLTHGLQASYLNQPVQVASLWSKLQNMMGGGFSQIVLSLGYPSSKISATPHRKVETVSDDTA
jgi:hypothetical protein